MALSKDDKRALKNKWKAQQKSKEYILSRKQAEKLFYFVEAQLDKYNCDHTRKYTEQWLNKNLPSEKIPDVLDEMKDMGGYCDCEVIMNCYEKYFD